MKEQPLRGAIVGFGQNALKAHLPALRSLPQFQITAVCDPRKEVLRTAQKEIEGVQTYSKAEELFRKEELDFAVIVTPPSLHTRLSLLALNHHVSVLCEKPLTSDPQEMALLEQAARKNHQTLFAVHNWKYAPILQKLSQIIHSGEIGKIERAEIQVLRLRPAASNQNWRNDRTLGGGGIVMDHGWHWFYLIPFLTGSEFRAVTASLTWHDSDVEGIADCHFEMQNGASVNIHLSWKADRRYNGGSFQCSKGRIDLEDDRLRLLRNGGERIISFSEKLSEGSYHPEWMRPMLLDFEQEMRSSEKRGNNLNEAKRCLACCEAVYKSQKQGSQKVTLSSC